MQSRKRYNTTELHIYDSLNRNIVHRDVIAHLFRWNHTLKIATIGMRILDVGCGSAGLFETFYRNRYKPAKYVGIDIREVIIQKNKISWQDKGAEFLCLDIVLNPLPIGTWDLITSFELLEHVGKKNIPIILDNIANVADVDTKILISTPCYNGVDYAENHVVEGEISELTFAELRTLLQDKFKIENVYGTFASVKDYKPFLSQYEGLPQIYEKLHEYYDSNALSVLMAPLFPEHSRNCLWELRKK